MENSLVLLLFNIGCIKKLECMDGEMCALCALM